MVGETPTNLWVFLLNMINLRCFLGDNHLFKEENTHLPDIQSSPVTHRSPRRLSTPSSRMHTMPRFEARKKTLEGFPVMEPQGQPLK